MTRQFQQGGFIRLDLATCQPYHLTGGDGVAAQEVRNGLLQKLTGRTAFTANPQYVGSRRTDDERAGNFYLGMTPDNEDVFRHFVRRKSVANMGKALPVAVVQVHGAVKEDGTAIQQGGIGGLDRFRIADACAFEGGSFVECRYAAGVGRRADDGLTSGDAGDLATEAGGSTQMAGDEADDPSTVFRAGNDGRVSCLRDEQGGCLADGDAGGSDENMGVVVLLLAGQQSIKIRRCHQLDAVPDFSGLSRARREDAASLHG